MKINKDWRFFLGELAQGAKTELDDSCFRALDLPHDWSIELPFDEKKGYGCTAYLPGGIGWYRKHFTTTADMQGKCVFLIFDGVYNNTDFYINATHLGFHPYGYSPIKFDLTPFLSPLGEDNCIAVYIDHTRYADSRWYTGSGIYRDVHLEVLDKLHIPVWGSFISTPVVSHKEAQITLDLTLNNTYETDKKAVVWTKIYSPNGELAAQVKEDVCLPASQSITTTQNFSVISPLLWGLESPHLYKAVSEVILDGKVIQSYVTPFGIRGIRFDFEKGFFLNEKNTKIKGVCLHHDCGLVGAAVPKGVWRRRLEKLKMAGCNAIRTAHNPPSAEFLDLCDELGFLVQNEFFDEWDNAKDKQKNLAQEEKQYVTEGYTRYFLQWSERDIKNTMLRDRNHPCIFQWSIGNEIEWTYGKMPAATGYWDGKAKQDGINYFFDLPPHSPEQIRQFLEEYPKKEHEIEETAERLAGYVREMDSSRPVVANCVLPSASYECGYTDSLDVVGYSYRQPIYDYAHKLYPGKPVLGTENFVQWHEWKAALERDFIAGIFLWTGIDYLGENGGNINWPSKGSNSGMLDFAGFEKPSYHMFKSLWSEEPHIYITTQTLEKSPYQLTAEGHLIEKETDFWKHQKWTWHEVNEHWNYQAEEQLAVEVYSNCESVELFLNDRSLGRLQLTDFPDRIYKWSVPFEEGALTAVGTKGAATMIGELKTASSAVSVFLSADRTQIHANDEDVVHIEAQLMDQSGNPVRTQEHTVTFHVRGDCKVLGVDNGSVLSVQPYQTNQVVTAKGRCLLILQAAGETGTVSVRADMGDHTGNSLTIEIE